MPNQGFLAAHLRAVGSGESEGGGGGGEAVAGVVVGLGGGGERLCLDEEGGELREA